MLLSILVPVYNERTVIERSLAQVLTAPLPEEMRRELVVVDDCSTDGTGAILERFAAEHSEIKLIRKPKNEGKGAAVRTAIQHAAGDFCLVQDADLEYDPNEYTRLLRPLLAGHADAVFGSRYLVSEQTRVLPYWHSMMNKSLTLLSNMFCNLNLTDMETCYKVFRTDLLKSIPIRSNRFGFEPEITMKSAKRKLRIYEVPISYHGRTYEEGKKIGWKDGVKALGVILRFSLIDDLYSEPYGRAFLNNMSGTPQYLNWLAGTLRPYLGDTVLELGAGIGNLAGRLMGRRICYVAAERNPLYLHALRNRFLRTPNVCVLPLDHESPSDYDRASGPFDTVLCINVLESAHDPRQVIACAREVLRPGGSLIILAPQGERLFGSLDRTLGHQWRFEREPLEAALADAGFEVTNISAINKIGRPSWWLFSRVLQRKQINKVTLKAFDKSVWFWKRTEFLLPWNGLSLIMVARKRQ